MAQLRWRFWLLVFALLPGIARGQDLLTLDAVVAGTLAGNASARAARAEAAAADADVRVARAGFFPRVSVSETWQRGDQPVFVFSSLLASRRFSGANFAIDALNHPPATGFFQARLAIDQLVFDGGRQSAALATARLQHTIANHTVSAGEADLVLAAADAYGRLLSAQADERAAEAARATADEDLARATSRRDAGMATDADVLAMAVHVADLRQRSILARGAAATACAEINRLMGAPVDRACRAAEPEVRPANAADAASLEMLFSRAEAARPELARAAARVELARQGRREARSALLPRVAAQAAFDVSGTSIGERASAWIVAADVRWSLSAGGAERAGRDAADRREAAARAAYDEVRAAVHVDVISALQSRDAARAREIVGRAAIEQARESQRIVRDRFDAGLAPVNDVLRASAALLDAEANRSAAVAGLVTSEARLRRALGADIPLTDRGVVRSQ